MKTWLSFLFTIFLVVTLSVSAQPTELSVNTHLSLDIIDHHLELQSDLPIQASECAYIQDQSEISEKSVQDLSFLFEGRSHANKLFNPVSSLASASLFQAKNQKNPDYQLKIDFSFLQLPMRLIELPVHRKEIAPWFLYASSSQHSRLSNWKDGNSLYTAKITYN